MTDKTPGEELDETRERIHILLEGLARYNCNAFTKDQLPGEIPPWVVEDDLLALLATQIAEARVNELERLYLVYGSKDNPASLDNLFSLGKKGEVCATPIKKRLAQLQKEVR